MLRERLAEPGLEVAADLAEIAERTTDTLLVYYVGMLLRLLQRGVDDGGELLRVADMYPWLHRELLSRSLPRPQQRGTDNIGELALVRNPAARAR